MIHIAALRGDLSTVELLLAAGEDINAIGDMGLTAAHYAASGQHKNVFDLLMDRGADASIVDEFDQTPPERWAFFAEDKGEVGRRT